MERLPEQMHECRSREPGFSLGRQAGQCIPSHGLAGTGSLGCTWVSGTAARGSCEVNKNKLACAACACNIGHPEHEGPRPTMGNLPLLATQMQNM